MFVHSRLGYKQVCASVYAIVIISIDNIGRLQRPISNKSGLIGVIHLE